MHECAFAWVSRYARVQEVHMFGQNLFCNVKVHYVTLVFAHYKCTFVTPTFVDDIPGTVAAMALASSPGPNMNTFATIPS